MVLSVSKFLSVNEILHLIKFFCGVLFVVIGGCQQYSVSECAGIQGHLIRMRQIRPLGTPLLILGHTTKSASIEMHT